MKYIKFIMPILIICLSIGYAAINITLSITGDTYIASDLDDFDVYFSYVGNNGVEDLSFLKSSDELDIDLPLMEVGTVFILDYEITNASSNFDALVSLSCEEEFVYVEHSTENLVVGAKQSISQSLTISSAMLGDWSGTATCKLTATPIERTTLGEGEVPVKIIPVVQIPVGQTIAIGNEVFNVIKDNGDTITMLAQLGLGTDYRQIEEAKIAVKKFSNSRGWEYSPGPKEIDIQQYDGNAKTYVNEYVSYLKGETGDTTLSGDLITLTELKSLGCTINDDYSYTSGLTCANSEYKSWLLNGQSWWTRSADPDSYENVWLVSAKETLRIESYASNDGVIRPVITISKSAL